MGGRIVFLMALTTLLLSVPALSQTEIESHPYFLAIVAAEHCEGQRATLLTELRLAQAISRDTGRRFSSQDVRAALNQQRHRADPGVCKLPQYEEALNLYRSVLNSMLQEPVLKAPEPVG